MKRFLLDGLIMLAIYFIGWGIYVNVRYAKAIYWESLDQTVKVINIEAEAKIHSPVSTKK